MVLFCKLVLAAVFWYLCDSVNCVFRGFDLMFGGGMFCGRL